MDEFKEQDKEYLAEVCNILYNFFDLWIVKLPNQLPPMCDI